MALETFGPQFKKVIESVSGIKQVHLWDELPGSLMTFPSAVIIPGSGTQTVSASGPNVAIHMVQVTVYVSAQVLPEGYAVAVPLIKKVRDVVAQNLKLNGTVNYCLPAQNRPFYEGPGGMSYADKTHLGINFYFDVKEVEALTVSS